MVSPSCIAEGLSRGPKKVDSPGYLHLLPPVAKEEIQRLWITSFGMMSSGGVVGIDLSGRLPPRRCKAPFLWPNAVEHVAPEKLKGIEGGAILVADGFLVPGKADGGIWLVTDPGGKDEQSARLTPVKKGWFYHRAVPFEIDGHQGVLTARAIVPVLPFQEPAGELVWLEKPNTTNPTSDWNLPWREIVIADGPDVMFEVADLDPYDGCVEVIAAEFFAQRMMLYSLQWDERQQSPQVVQRDIIDDTLGQAYAVQLADLDGPRSHLVVTTHEYLPVESKSGSAFGWMSSGKSWSYTNIQAPADSRALESGESVQGGSMYAYKVPERWKRRPDRVKNLDRFKAQLPELFDRLDKTKTGLLTEQELQAAMGTLGMKISLKDVNTVFSQADWDGSGSIGYEEFEKLLVAQFQSESAPLGKVAEAVKIFENAVASVQEEKISDPRNDPTFKARLQELFSRLDVDKNGGIDMSEMRASMQIMGVTATDVEIAAMFVNADLDSDGLIDPSEFESLLVDLAVSGRPGANMWGKVLNSLEVAIKQTAALADGRRDSAVWQKTTLASGFSVKRMSINPGAPGFVYPFYPHDSMREAGHPPHLLLAGDCADAAYVFKPVKGSRPRPLEEEIELSGGTESLSYQLIATFGYEGTVGSIAVGRMDTLKSVDDGWAKFLVPVYETNRVYLFKCGDLPTRGFTPDDEW